MRSIGVVYLRCGAHLRPVLPIIVQSIVESRSEELTRVHRAFLNMPLVFSSAWVEFPQEKQLVPPRGASAAAAAAATAAAAVAAEIDFTKLFLQNRDLLDCVASVLPSPSTLHRVAAHAWGSPRRRFPHSEIEGHLFSRGQTGSWCSLCGSSYPPIAIDVGARGLRA